MLPNTSALFSLFLVTQSNWAQEQPYFQGKDGLSPSSLEWVQVPELSDEFQDQSLDLTKWQAEPVGNGWNWLGRPPALFRAENVVVKDSMMNITVSKLPKPVSIDKLHFTHQGAIVRSLHPGQLGWYFECRMKANATEMSSTFWLMTKGPQQKKLELDIQECVGTVSPNAESWVKNWDQIFHSNLIHRVNQNNPGKVQVQAQKKTATKNHERFYVYGAWWKSADEVEFFPRW